MPLYDVQCAAGHEAEYFLHRHSDTLPPCACGLPVEKIWRATPTVIDDSIPGGWTLENMGPTPITVYSKSEWRREMKARGLTNRDEHVGVPGTDKSPVTTRWV